MMLENKNADKINEVAEKLTEAVRDSYETTVESTAAVQKSSTRLAQSFYEGGVEALKIQAELQQQTLQNMAEKIRKHQEVFQKVSQESLGAYDGFMGSLFSYYREVLGESEDSRG
jgi:hypothetical protein